MFKKIKFVCLVILIVAFIEVWFYGYEYNSNKNQQKIESNQVKDENI